MKSFDHTCTKCNAQFEVEVYDDEEPIEVCCPVCNHVWWVTLPPKKPNK